MCIGLKRGIVELVPHQAEWESIAAHTVEVLKNILENAAVDVQHIGSTSIKLIRAKPIIDIAVAAEDFDAVLAKKTELEAKDIIFCLDERPEQLLFVMGDFAADTRKIYQMLSPMKGRFQNRCPEAPAFAASPDGFHCKRA